MRPVTPWIVLVDLDSDHDCAPPLRAAWLPHPAPQMCFRVAVRAVEAWLMADAERLAAFIGVARRRISADPEREENPKRAMVNLARSSRASRVPETRGLRSTPEAEHRGLHVEVQIEEQRFTLVELWSPALEEHVEATRCGG